MCHAERFSGKSDSVYRVMFTLLCSWEATVGYVVSRHGDMVFLDIDQDATSASEMSVDSTPTPSTVTGNQSSSASLPSMMSRPSFSSRDVVADTVDEFLWNQDGKIPRQRNEQL